MQLTTLALPTYLQLEPVGVDRLLADDLRKPSRALPPEEIHLEEPEPRVHVTRREEQVMVGLRGDVRGAVLLEQHLDGLLEAGKVDHTVGVLGVGGHRPRAGHGVEGGTKRRQRSSREPSCIEDGGGDDRRGGEVDERQKAGPAACRRGRREHGGWFADRRLDRHVRKFELWEVQYRRTR